MGVKDHLKHRLNPKTIGREVYAHLTEKTIPHGQDELGNILFSGSAYLPWPGKGGPEPIAAPHVEAAVEPVEEGVSYTDRLNDAADRGDNDNDRGRSR